MIDSQNPLTILNSLESTYFGGNTTTIEAKDEEWLSQTFAQPFLLITQITNGSIIIETDTGHYTIESGQALIIPPQIKYKVKLLGTHFVTHWLNLNYTLFEYFHLFDNIEVPYVTTVSIGNQIGRLQSEITSLLNIQHAQTNVSLIAMTQVKKHLLSLLELVLSIPHFNVASFKDTSRYQRFQSVLSYIENHLADKIKISQLAELMYISTSYFYREFKESFQMSPMHYVHQQRLKKAQYLLATTDLTIGEIANRVGYNNAYPFIRFFKSMNGCSPGTYKKMISTHFHTNRAFDPE